METVAWKNDRWVPTCEAALALDDCGVLYGAMVVDRLRTFRGRAWDVEEHVERFRIGCTTMGIELPADVDLIDVTHAVAERNLAAFGGSDLAIVLLGTPGRIGENRPTLVAHPAGIDRAKLGHWYTDGQPLVVADVHSVPPSCWSPQLKVRSRLNFYLADRSARSQLGPTAGAILRDATGGLTETSAANVLIVEGGRLVSPPSETILHGISLRRTQRLAAGLGIELGFEPISVQRAIDSEGLLLCGSVGCLWFASQLGSHLFRDPGANPVYTALRQAWVEDLGIDFSAGFVGDG